jgi:hypothetical protein
MEWTVRNGRKNWKLLCKSCGVKKIFCDFEQCLDDLFLKTKFTRFLLQKHPVHAGKVVTQSVLSPRNKRQGRQCTRTYKVKLRRVYATMFDVEK